MLIVSLSSIPTRFPKIGETLQSLLRQSARIDRIYLYVPDHYRRFPDWDGTLPEVPEGVEIRRTDQDLGPATKVLAAAREFRGQDCDILFGDDDRAYPRNWADRFVKARKEHPDCCITNLGIQANTIVDSTETRELQPRAIRRWRITDVEFRLRKLAAMAMAGRNWATISEPGRRVYKRSGYVDIFEGCAGVMVKPDFFDDVAYDIPSVLWSVDDVWLSGMLARRGIPIWLLANIREPGDTEAQEFDPLVTSVVDGADRETANAMGVRHMQTTYGVWL